MGLCIDLENSKYSYQWSDVSDQLKTAHRPMSRFLFGGFASGVIGCAHHMKRHIGLVSYDPTVMAGFDVEEVAGLHFEDAAVVHGGGASTEMTMPTWETSQLVLPRALPTCSDHFQPGS
jgi:hypothetical protein